MRRRSRRSRRRRRRLLALACAAALALVAAWAWTRAGTSPDAGTENGADVATSPVVEEAAASDQASEEVETVTSVGLVVTGPEEFLGSEELAYLEEQVAELEEQDVNLGIVVLDLETGHSIEYNADERLYPASSIKAAYCAMVCEEYGGAGELSWALEECLVNSSNGAYELLRDTYGLDAFGDWLEHAGATEASVQAREYGYPDISAGELAEVWEEIYRFGTSGERARRSWWTASRRSTTPCSAACCATSTRCGASRAGTSRTATTSPARTTRAWSSPTAGRTWSPS